MNLCKLISCLILFCTCSDIQAQLLSYNRHFSEGRRSIKYFNPFVCVDYDSIPYLQQGGGNDFTLLNGDIYTISPDNVLRMYNSDTYLLDSVFKFENRNAIGIAGNENDSLYIITANGLFFKYNIFDNSYESFDIDSGFQAKLGYHEGRLYGAQREGIFELSTADGSIIQKLVDRPDSLGYFYSLAVNKYNCEEVSMIIIGKHHELDTLTYLYEYFLNTGEFRHLCNTDLFIWAITDLPVEYECELLVDADRDKSGGWLPIHFRQDALCGAGWSYVTDRDPYVYSSVGKIDSLVATLQPSAADGLSEFLELDADSGFSISGSGSRRIVIQADEFADYERALQNLRYVHTGTQVTPGTREIHLLAHRLERVSDTARCEIPVFLPTTAGAGAQLEFCQDDGSLDLSLYLDPDADPDGQWSQDPILSIDTPAEYRIFYVSSADHCPGDTATFDVRVYEVPLLTLGPDITLCNGLPFSIGPVFADPSYTYNWSDGSSSPQLIVSQSGTYRLTISNGPCSLELAQSITFEDPIQSGLPDMVERCDSSIVLTATDSSAYQYLWSTGATTPAIEVQSSGIYYLQVSSGTCSITDTVEVRLFSIQVPDTPDYLQSCGEDIVLDITVTTPDLSILWQDGSTGFSYTASQSGIYSYELLHGPCTHAHSIEVVILEIVAPDLGADRQLCDTATLILHAGQGWDIYLWNTGETTEYITAQSGIYTVEVAKDFCTATSAVRIDRIPCKTCRVFIPNAVTPNGDGVNDRLEVLSNCELEIIRLEVYDRWGARVYRGSDATAMWPTPQTKEDVYVAIVTYKDEMDDHELVISAEISVLR